MTVEATVEKQGKEKKVVIYKYNPKKHLACWLRRSDLLL